MFLLQELLNYGEILLFARFATQVKLRESRCTPKHHAIAKTLWGLVFCQNATLYHKVEVVWIKSRDPDAPYFGSIVDGSVHGKASGPGLALASHNIVQHSLQTQQCDLWQKVGRSGSLKANRGHPKGVESE